MNAAVRLVAEDRRRR